jgi:FtsZ-binding cell division protein ZapB
LDNKNDLKSYRFVNTLFKILDEPLYENVISFNKTGETIIIKHSEQFSKFILPEYYKHSNLSSFVRQMNKYDFHKVKTEDSVNMEGWIEFYHPCFKRDSRDISNKIKRKTSGKRKSSCISINERGSRNLLSEIGKPITPISSITQYSQGYNSNQGYQGYQGGGLTEEMKYLKMEMNKMKEIQSNLMNSICLMNVKYDNIVKENEEMKRQMMVYEDTVRVIGDIVINRGNS